MPIIPHLLLLDLPASLDAGKADHRIDLKGPLIIAATIAEDSLLEYTNGVQADQVGWGGLDPQTLRQWMERHTAASDLTRSTYYVASSQASNLLAHILDTQQQAATDKPVPGALGNLGDKAVVLVGHDTNLANIAGALQINWLIDGRLDDKPPAGGTSVVRGIRLRIWSSVRRQPLPVLSRITNPIAFHLPPLPHSNRGATLGVAPHGC